LRRQKWEGHVMKLVKEHRINVSAARYIELAFDHAFDKRINIEGMGNQACELLNRSVDGPTWTMHSRITPPDNMPGFIKKLVGGGFAMEDRRTHQKGALDATGELLPSALRDKVKMGYKLRVVPDGDSACKRIMDWEIEVKIFGIGGQVEKFIAGEIEKGLDASARFFNQHAATHGKAS